MNDPGPEPIDARAAMEGHDSFRHAAGAGRCLVHALLLVAPGYSHPLGLFMIAAHGPAHENAPSVG